MPFLAPVSTTRRAAERPICSRTQPSVLDQSPSKMGISPDECIRESSTLAFRVEVLGASQFYDILARMAISLTPEQHARLSAYVARGDFASVEEAAIQLIDERIAERALEEGDSLAWAKPYVEEALEDVARGNIVTREEHHARNVARLAALKG